MLIFYKTTDAGLIRLDEVTNGCWIHVVDPTTEEMAQLKTWGLEPELIASALDLDEMARTERDEEYVLILLRIPYFQGTGVDIPYITIPLSIILTDRFVVTVCKYENDITRALCNGKYRGLKTGKRYRFALYIFLETATRYLTHVREINKTVEQLEDRLQQSTRNREVLEILKYQKSLVYYTTGLRSNQVVMERLQRTQLFNQYEEDRELLEDVITENQQALEMTHIASDILSQMMDAFASIISNNLNVVMKVLAALTIIINIPTIFASLYGMNVPLPGGDHPLMLVIIILLSMITSGIAAYIFYKKDWL
jgi:magnesium transporter